MTSGNSAGNDAMLLSHSSPAPTVAVSAIHAYPADAFATAEIGSFSVIRGYASQPNTSHSSNNSTMLLVPRNPTVPASNTRPCQDHHHANYNHDRRPPPTTSIQLLSQLSQTLRASLHRLSLTERQEQPRLASVTPFSEYRKSTAYAAATLHCWTAADIVTLLAVCIQSSDRRLAVAVGRSLVEHGFLAPCATNNSTTTATGSIANHDRFRDEGALWTLVEHPEPASPPQGVLIALTPCYSATCRSGLYHCYSPSCPRFGSQSLHLLEEVRQKETLWSEVIPRSTYLECSASERRRQEVIFELILTEKEYLRDLQILVSTFREPLLTSDIIEPEHRQEVIKALFGNVDAILAVNTVLLDRLLERQRRDHLLVHAIGDIFIRWIDTAGDVYIQYIADRILAKYILEMELANNPKFVRFCEANERRPECRKLSIHSFLSRPTTRIGRYPLLLEAALQHLDSDHPDQKNLMEAVTSIRAVLKRSNRETGIADNALQLRILHDRLLFRPEHAHWKKELQLLDPDRMLLRSGTVRWKRNGVEWMDVELILADNCLLITRRKHTGVRVVKQSIPLQQLVVRQVEQQEEGLFERISIALHEHQRRFSSGEANTASPTDPPNASGNVSPSSLADFAHFFPKDGYPLVLEQLGKHGQVYELFTASHAEQKNWIESLRRAIGNVVRSTQCYRVRSVFSATKRIAMPSSALYCSTVYDGMEFYGMEDGMYRYQPESSDGPLFEKIVPRMKVTIIEIVAEFGVFFIQSENKVFYYPLELLYLGTPGFTDSPTIRREIQKGCRLSRHTAFFRVGRMLGRTFVAVVKTKLMTTYIKVYEHVLRRGGEGGTGKWAMTKLWDSFRRFTTEEFKLCKEIYVPGESLSVHFLKSKLVVGSVRGFELIDLVTLQTQALLDTSDPTLSFVTRLRSLAPMALFRTSDEEFFLCFSEFGVLVDKYGRNARPSTMPSPTSGCGGNRPFLSWIGVPTSFAYDPPYVVAFSPTLVEVWDLNTGMNLQVMDWSQFGGVRALDLRDPSRLVFCTDSHRSQEEEEAMRDKRESVELSHDEKDDATAFGNRACVMQLERIAPPLLAAVD